MFCEYLSGSFGGGRVLTINGAGYDETAVVTVCNNSCPISNFTSSFIECEVPANSGETQTCFQDDRCLIVMLYRHRALPVEGAL